MANQQTGYQYITKITAEHIIRAQETEDLEEQLEYQEESKEQDKPEIESEANKTGNKEELNDISDTPLVEQPKQNISGT